MKLSTQASHDQYFKTATYKNTLVRIFLCDHLLTFRFSLHHRHHQIPAFSAAGHLLLRNRRGACTLELPLEAGKNSIASLFYLSEFWLSKRVVAHGGKQVGVTYDERSLIVNGKRELLFSGSIHYPRSTPDMWPELILKAKAGGLNVIQTYVFWNIHEPEQGKFNFEGPYDLVKFLKTIGENGMYATLRLGPFIQAEWNHGGLPYWLREIPDIIFRSDNEPFKHHMEKFVTKIIDMMKEEKMFASQGGPIILSQINTCNGRQCGDTFTGPNKPNKPSLWTENWTAQFRVFGDPPSQRSAEDTAFSVARWFSKNGLQREPKWGHLKDLHRALNLCKKALLWGSPNVQKLSADVEVRIFEQPGTKVCAAFLANNNSKEAETVQFRGQEYYLPARSISILPDCKTVVYNTMTVVSQHNSRSFVKSRKTNKLDWNMYSETIPAQLVVDSILPKELYNLTKDKTDYTWFTTTINVDRRDMNERKRINPVLRVASLGHAMVAFVNGEFVGSAHGSQIEKSFVLQHSVDLKPGINFVTLLGTLVGLPDSGAYMEHRYAGPRGVSILGLNTGTLDLTSNGWGHQVGLSGETAKLFTEEGGEKVTWTKVQKAGPPVTWYKIEILTVNRDTICSYVTEYHPPSVKSWERKNNNFTPVVDNAKPAAHLKCPNQKKIIAVQFASFGDPLGTCGEYAVGTCHSPVSKQVVEEHCLGKTSCDIPVDKGLFAGKKDDCPDTSRTLAVQVKCSNKDPKRSAN
ncbi:hypothetical protein OIU84_009424 [Salix udensis]|uniref:beta-galactosidase n=1 Tax=Salix udensis TaxID=889485 RepID=A0AAD6JRF8_9ROSI|nr:hypothetical protein OIU84_009424 [Salix udensis]